METNFKMGSKVTETDKNGMERSVSSQPWIWPACLPKEDSDPVFESDKGMIAGWLDAPPLDQTFTRILGNVGEAEVYRYFYPRVAVHNKVLSMDS